MHDKNTVEATVVPKLNQCTTIPINREAVIVPGLIFRSLSRCISGVTFVASPPEVRDIKTKKVTTAEYRLQRQTASLPSLLFSLILNHEKI